MILFRQTGDLIVQMIGQSPFTTLVGQDVMGQYSEPTTRLVYLFTFW